MKTLKKINKGETEYKRMDDLEASRMVKSGWSYCSKSEWKKEVRDFGKEKEENPSSSQERIYNKDKKNSKAKNEKTSS